MEICSCFVAELYCLAEYTRNRRMRINVGYMDILRILLFKTLFLEETPNNIQMVLFQSNITRKQTIKTAIRKMSD